MSVGGGTAGLVAGLEAGWAAIQARHPEVPDVVLTVELGRRGQAGPGRCGAEQWARCSAGGPRPAEVSVDGGDLAGGAAAVLTRLLHEAAHALAHARRVKDTSRQGRYHNARYRELAGILGLVCEDAGAHGWADTRLPPSSAETYRGVLVALDAARAAFPHPVEPQRSQGKPQKGNGVVARCQCARQFRITASVLAAGPIVCAVCQTAFENTTGELDDNDQEQDR